MTTKLTVLALLAGAAFAAEPAFQQQFIFAPQKLHAHSSSIVELADGRLMTCWYIGSGERTADDVKVQAAFLKKGAKEWDAPFTLDDTPGFPDTNPLLFVDSKQRLWFLWTAILDNRWETALLKLRISEPALRAPMPKWSLSDNVLLIPEGFAGKVSPRLRELVEPVTVQRDRNEAFTAIVRSTDKLLNRLGWMPRIHPLELPSGRVLLPLYSDTYNLSLVAITDDGGKTWRPSEPLVSLGGVQPSLVRKKDGTVVAYMRDNGPPPQRVLVSESRDDGVNWSAVTDSEIPNPGSSVEVIALKTGEWVMVLNDTEKGRNRISVWMSPDEGRTWPWKKSLENTETGGYSYPSVIQTRDGKVHATYSFTGPHAKGEKELQTIKHVAFDKDWVKK
ncbi:sialidase family protein [Paludibaculum fermentans]|uniref:Exo-alpha-sialidase n=1 Tax=Paludibaculum fermentans TaxID=1473598 RepID=A0A7S7NMC7_PALFE|nr:exo-alpha-sialidase [Paludibaculum fermentans]QOY86190.1 exo-alpha-sialidase [Paludibaculum fermentans]